jgi:hypothetical protein
MRSLLAQGLTPFTTPSGCTTVPCRTEVTFSFKQNGRIYSFVARDKIIPEDPYFTLVKAAAFAIQQNEPYNGRTPPRSLKDFLVRSNLLISG